MAASLPNANDLTQRFALDVQGFDALREQAKQSPRAGAKAVAGQFDAMFTQMMLKSATHRPTAGCSIRIRRR